ncbi:acetyl-CoA carboxylase biotin carboxylase subunit [Peredibacter starrii]|uniref:Biotin carboxylase N-terminal domain-containing protein n=1 Tax=Peredibacter starrii TaxID=28202 RepID=A0AAX4HQ08_9BACT|nr:biotin carboxylase N-terminal domain-containing protein [Peredibacter starrii]WPU65217.1 biotin carboxylase N-terminal domain-containing protein [Peredibacter starrii]
MKGKRVLIINRGEIAIRVAKALNELGLVSVGVWTDNETEPPHLEFCQEWVHLAGNNNKETYLDIPKIMKLIDDYKIDGVHPGYGFLSENREFSEALAKKGVTFIGPNPTAVYKMGAKDISKQVAKEAGVPVVPGSTGEVPSVEEAIKLANDMGYPILLKAVAGGGGKGMRPCYSEEEIKANFAAVQREALSGFGYAGLLVEKYILNPHHIEVQILADKKGNVFHVFERECSVQRRHQKIIEEAPSPFIGTDEALRKSICETAVKCAKAVNYDSAGTVEFIMGEDKKFYFLEMNTRIQVEHPITEEITGVDLVANMIKAAFGEPLDFKTQDDIKIQGHAIELRICAEDPISMLPAPGKIVGFETTFPQGIRFDHCIYPKFTITPDFDPMIGKLIAKGFNREVALRKVKSALDGLIIDGIKTNIALHRVILNEENFVKGHYSTNYIGTVKPQEKVAAKEDIKAFMLKVAAIELNQAGGN